MIEKHSMLSDRYRIIGLLGEGRYSFVYDAEDILLDRRVAIKTVKRDLLKDKPQYRAIFLREAKYLASLEHPNIIPLYEFFDSQSGPILVLRHVKGNLFQFLENYSGDNLSFIISVAEQVATALDYCVVSGISHRDIKPDNILVNDSGQAYITDFGAASPFAISRNWKKPVGATAYLSPELLITKEIETDTKRFVKCDQFSFGVLLYQILTGELPHGQAAPGKYDPKWANCTALRLINQEMPIPCYEKNSTIPYGVDRIISKMLSVDPDDRYPNNMSAVNDLAEELSGRESSGTQIFVSFSHHDLEFVSKLVEDLQIEGFSVWWDRHLDHGIDWDEQIEEAMHNSQFMLMILSPDSVNSAEAKHEWKYWIDDLHKGVIPIMYKKCRPPYRYSKLQHITALNKSSSEIATEVRKSILKSLEGIKTNDIKFKQTDFSIGKGSIYLLNNLTLQAVDLYAEEKNSPWRSYVPQYYANHVPVADRKKNVLSGESR